MRITSVILLTFAVGCGGSNGAPAGTPSDLGTNLDGHLSNQPGTSCITACDCQPGEACQSGQCVTNATPMYCCESSNCPATASCQAMNGSFSTCPSSTGTNGGTNGGTSGGTTGTIGGLSGFGGSGDGGIIGGLSGGSTGAGGYCGYIPCSQDSDCTGLGCSSCDTASGKCQ